MGIASSAFLPSNEYLAHALHQLRRTLRQEKTLAFVVAGLIGLAFFLSIHVISVRRELAKESTDAATDALAAASTSPHQIEFAERFAIEPRSPISLEAVNLVRHSGGCYTVLRSGPNVRPGFSGAGASAATSQASLIVIGVLACPKKA